MRNLFQTQRAETCCYTKTTATGAVHSAWAISTTASSGCTGDNITADSANVTITHWRPLPPDPDE